MRFGAALPVVLLALSALSCSPRGGAARSVASASPSGAVKHVVFVTVDGLLPEVYLHPDAHGLKVPTIRSLVQKGASSAGALSVYPSLTYPSHTSMATGVNPGKHGVVGNRSFDPFENDLEGWRWYAEDIQRDPIWRIARRAGYSVATIHWPVSVGADVTWRVPEYWRAKNEEDKKVLRAVSTPGLLESVGREVPDFWSRYLPPNVHDDALTDIAVHLLRTEKPTLTMLHLVEVDGAQHAYGVFSEDAVRAIENTDVQIARIITAIREAGMEKETAIVIASDHGFMNAGSMVRAGVLLREAGLVTINSGRVVSWKATLLNNSGHAYIYLNDAGDHATAEAVRVLFDAKAKDPKSGIGRVYSHEEVVALGGDPKAFLGVEPAVGFQFGPGFSGDYVAAPLYRATHGYDPRRPEMKASLILAGPSVPHGLLEGARLIDIAPTIASWLGLAMPNVDGTPLVVHAP